WAHSHLQGSAHSLGEAPMAYGFREKQGNLTGAIVRQGTKKAAAVKQKADNAGRNPWAEPVSEYFAVASRIFPWSSGKKEQSPRMQWTVPLFSQRSYFCAKGAISTGTRNEVWQALHRLARATSNCRLRGKSWLAAAWASSVAPWRNFMAC